MPATLMESGCWIEERTEVGGPLIGAAARFVRGPQWGRPLPPRGAAALSALANAVEASCDTGAVGEDAFIEGAGALLGLVLVDCLGGAGHVEFEGKHRVRLGQFGCFDPFSAIESALQADSPRAALADRVRLAEAEARGDGPMAKAVRLADEAARRLRLAEGVDWHWEYVVRLGDGRLVDLSPLAHIAESDGTGTLRAAVERLLGFAVEEAQLSPEEPWSAVSHRLLPRLVGPSFSSRLGHDAERLAMLPLAGHLMIALVRRAGRGFRYVTRKQLSTWDISERRAYARALENLEHRSQQVRFLRRPGPVMLARQGDGFDATRLLLPKLRAQLGARLGVPFIVAVPNRDMLLACPRDTPACAVLGDYARSEAPGPYQISRVLYEATESSLTPVSAS